MADYAALRRRMVDTQLIDRGIRHPTVLRAMATVPPPEGRYEKTRIAEIASVAMTTADTTT